MDKLKDMKEALVTTVQGQINGNLEKVDAKELGEAVDMIKDFAQAMYYCTIVEQMEKNNEQPYNREDIIYEDERNYYPVMYYPQGSNSGNGRRSYYPSNGRNYHEDMWDAYRDIDMVYPRGRKHYSEEQHQDVEHYLKGLSSDVSDMIKNATPEERQMLQQKLSSLANKIQ